MTGTDRKAAPAIHPRARRCGLLAGTAMLAAMAAPQAAWAQDSDQPSAEAGDGDERVIIVQARRQNESLQEVPVTITSVSGETLDKFVINQVASMASRVPTLNVQVGGSGSGGQLSLRGLGSWGFPPPSTAPWPSISTACNYRPCGWCRLASST